MSHLERKAQWILGIVVLLVFIMLKIGFDFIGAATNRFNQLEARITVMEIYHDAERDKTGNNL